MDLPSILNKIGSFRDDMVKTMCQIISIPAMSPINGGSGEGKRADMLQGLLNDFDDIQRIDVPDGSDPSIRRSNILAKKGNGKGTLWFVAHMDTVPAGDLSAWDTDPFQGVVSGDRIYGRGTEDNGQAIISAIYASKCIPSEMLTKRSLGLALVADEETSNRYGIEYLLDHDHFSEDDVFIVPDWGSPNGSMVDVAEKSLLWLRFEVIGKTTHGSTPHFGKNAFRYGTKFLAHLMDALEERFGMTDGSFMPPYSTFEPTKNEITSVNVNTIPGRYEFCMDMRILPSYDLEDIVSYVNGLAHSFSEENDVDILVTEIQRHVSGRPSSTDTDTFRALSDSVEEVFGNRPSGVGVGGGTCANFFRLKGYDAYVWQSGGGTLHGPNEYVLIDSLVDDAKVMAGTIWRLCV